MNNENNNVVPFPTKGTNEVTAEMQSHMAEMVEPAKTPISECINKEPVHISEAQPLPIGNGAPVGVVISGGEITTVTEIPEAVKAQMEADANAEAQPIEPAHQLDENDPLNEVSEQQMCMLMKQVREMMGMFEAQWNSTKQEFQLKDSHMQLLYAYNNKNAKHMPDGMSPEEQAKFDPFNGLDSITEEDVIEIFGEGHPIIGLEHTITVDRIKSVTRDFYSWMSTLREYQQIHDSYMDLIETKEEEEIKFLQEHCDKEEDPEKKKKMQEAINTYYSRKYLDFIAEPLDENKIEILVKAFSDEKKIQYWIERARTKLMQLKISSKFILEISQFEKRFLPAEFHGHNNIFLVYFLNLVVYANMGDKLNVDRNKVACIVFGMDKVVRNAIPAVIREKIMNNMIEFQKQFIGKLPTAKVEEVLQSPGQDVQSADDVTAEVKE